MSDLLVIKPGAQKALYQGLSESLSGLEPPLWAALLSAYVREKGFTVKIIDAEMEPATLLPRMISEKPRLVAIVVSGTNPSASTMNMAGAKDLLKDIAGLDARPSTILVGLHPSSLPEKTLREEPVDWVCEGEGFTTVVDLLNGADPAGIRGLWYRKSAGIVGNPRADLVDPNDLPAPAWDLLPMHRYRAHNWHCFGRLDQRTPYGVVYTSLGCPFHCTFCCINAIFGKSTIRYRSPKKVVEEIDQLVGKYNIRNIKILDEMFALNEPHVTELCDLLRERDYDLNIWAYARVDTLRERMVRKMKGAGIRWLAIGFESGSQAIRAGVRKGNHGEAKILDVVRMVREAGIHIAGNFIFGLPGDDPATMRATLDLANKIDCEYANFYVAMAYPGSRLFHETPAGFLPKRWEGYSQMGYETLPLPTKALRPEEILRFRDRAFDVYHGRKEYQDRILEKFGEDTLRHVRQMLRTKLERRLLKGEPECVGVHHENSARHSHA